MSTITANPPSTPLSVPRKPTLVIEPTSGWAALNLLEVWTYKDLLLSLALRDLKLRYKQTALGAVWVVLQPLLAAGIFSFVFGIVAKMPSDGVPYFVFSYAGLLGWNLFAGSLGRVSNSLVGNSHLISKIFFPRLVLPFSGLPSVLVDFAVASVMAAILIMSFQINPGWGLLLLPVWIITLMLFSMGIGLVTASLAVSYRDVNYIIPVALQMLLYASPIAYAVSAIPEQWQNLYYLNPLTSVLEAFRFSLLGTGQLKWGWLAYSGVWALGLFVVGLFSFKRMERRFADVI